MSAFKNLSRIVASRHLIARPIKEVQDALMTLDALELLSDNLSDITDTFGQHFRIGGIQISPDVASQLTDTFGQYFRIGGIQISPDVASQLKALEKAREGLAAAKRVQEAMTSVLQAYPSDKTALRAAKDAGIMVKRFAGHEADAAKMIRTISKKEMPASLTKVGAAAARLIKAQLVDPKLLQVIPWQQKRWIDGREGVIYQVVLRIEDKNLTGGYLRGKAEVMVVESTLHSGGPRFNDVIATPKAVAENMFKQLHGWTGLKGEGDKIQGRATTAQGIKSALNSALRRMRAYDYGDTNISADNSRIEASYRSDLPKEGESSVGEWEYGEMVDAEIKRAKKVVEPALRPYLKQIKNINYQDEEKSWIYVTVYLK